MTTEKQQKKLRTNNQNNKNGVTKANNSNAVTQRNKNVAIEKTTPEKLKKYLDSAAYILAGGHPELIMQELDEKILPRIMTGKMLTPQMAENIKKALMDYGLDTNYPITETVAKRYGPLVIEFGHQLIKEYDCKTPSEKALAQVAVGAYGRILDYSTKLAGSLMQDWFIEERLHFFSILSKEIDRAERQFITALVTLRQIKTPSLEINVKTKNAFVAQNQQLNINPSNNNENIEPK
jgi:hypothetical protein